MERRSRQKEEIKRILAQKNFHPTIEEVYSIAKEHIPGVGIATIYRNIEKMLNNNEINKIDIPGEAARIDGNTEKHYHFRCTKCGNVQDIWLDVPIDELIQSSSILSLADITDHKLEFTGVCTNCKENTH
jgi:Fe2+ or Zn2+ uptake regulation protein